MKIGFDYTKMYPGKIGGMEQFVRNIILSLTKILNVEIFVFVTDQNKDYFENQEKINTVFIKNSPNIIKDTQILIAQTDLDVIVCPFTIVETTQSNKLIVSFFPDTQCYDYPNFFDKANLKARIKNFEDAAKYSDLMVTISEFSRDSIIRHLSIPQEKVKFIYLDSDKVFENPINKQKNAIIKEKYKLPDQYIFFPANTWEHKNHINLIKAFNNFLLKNPISKIKLVFTGDINTYSNKIKKIINKHNLQKDILFLGYISQEDMPYLYNNALFMAFPSFYEGFGIPLVEAMRSNCAVTCSNQGSLPEIGKDAVLFFDPHNINEIEDSLIKMLNEDFRNSLIQKGSKIAKNFSWDKSATELYNLLDERIESSKKYKENPLVSIITPSFNQGEFIENTILSVLNQTYKNIEFIIMDGGSTDNTIDILKKYSDKLTWISEKDNGQADAVHNGILKAKGSIIGWLNSDDTYYPDAVKIMVDYFSKYPDQNVIYGEADYIDKSGQFIEKYPTQPFNNKTIAEMCYICQPATFFKKETYLNIGGLDTKLQMCMDYDLWIRLSKKTDLFYIYDTIATSRLYNENKTLGQRDAVYKEVLDTVKHHFNYVPYKWIVGYVTHLTKDLQIGFLRKKILLTKTLLQYNWTNPLYLFKHFISKFISLLRLVKNAYHFNGLYEDGWVGKKYQSMLDLSKANKITVIGKNCGIIKNNLSLFVYINDEKISTIKLPASSFTFSSMIDKKHQLDNAILTIKPNKTFLPLLRLKPDYRFLSFQLSEIRVVKKEDNV